MSQAPVQSDKKKPKYTHKHKHINNIYINKHRVNKVTDAYNIFNKFTNKQKKHKNCPRNHLSHQKDDLKDKKSQKLLEKNQNKKNLIKFKHIHKH